MITLDYLSQAQINRSIAVYYGMYDCLKNEGEPLKSVYIAQDFGVDLHISKSKLYENSGIKPTVETLNEILNTTDIWKEFRLSDYLIVVTFLRQDKSIFKVTFDLLDDYAIIVSGADVYHGNAKDVLTEFVKKEKG
jgi:hypothetical protein